MTNDEQGHPRVRLDHLPAVLDNRVRELLHVMDYSSLPLTLAVANVIVTKHQETLGPPDLCQLIVVGDKVLSMASNKHNNH